MNLLHLSDLHFGTIANAKNWFSQIADDLKYELNCNYIDALIISGDIANKSTPKEYSAAKQFIDSFCQEFNVNSDQIIIVPGNHDLNWSYSKQAYTLKRREEYKGPFDEEGNPDRKYTIDNGDFGEIQNPKKYKQRFKNFNSFYKKVTGDPYPSDYEDQAILYHFPKLKLLILGLNSAWQIDHYYTSRASINSDALSNALNKIRNNLPSYEQCLKMAVWHHPLISTENDRIADNSFLQRLAQAGFNVALHGHIHKSENNVFRYDKNVDGRRIEIISAGTFGALTRDWVAGYPLQYNLLKFNQNKITVETRCRRELDGAWTPDALWTQGPRKDPLPRYEIDLPVIGLDSEVIQKNQETNITKYLNDTIASNAKVDELVLHLRNPRSKSFDGKKRAIADATLSYDPEEKGKRNIETEPFIFEAPIGPIEKDDLRWYLERYSTWPTGVFKQRAENIVKHLPIWGKALYDQIFLKVSAFDVLMAWKSSTGKRRFTVYVNSMLAAGAKKNKKKQMEANEAASELLGLPWELLHDGSSYLFQGAKPVQVRRQLPNTKVLDAAVWNLPVRILLVSPRPGEEYVSYIDHRVTAMPLVEAVEKLGGLAELTVLTPATFPRLEEELNRAQQNGKPYHAVHFDGHGVFSRREGLGGLCFEDHEDSKKIENRRCEIIDAKELAGMIKDHRIPLFFLEACQSAKSEEDPTASVAAALLKEGAASVVAMSHTVLVETSRRFVEAFYKELTKGSRVGDAMVAGHRELYAKPDRGTIFGAGKLEMQDWFVPVLYQEKEDAALLKTPNQKLLEVQEPFLEKVPGLLTPYGELPDVPGHGFIGRSRELLKMERMLEQKRYMVICGQGGEGKTAIACELGRWLVRTGRYDGVVFVSVEHIYNVRAVVDGVGRQLVENYSVAQYRDTELLKGALEPIENVLREKRVLIILDNMESILPAVGNEGGDLSAYAVQMEPGELGVFFQLCKKLNGVGKTGLVFTSREALPKPMDARGNRVELGRLSTKDAVELVKEVMSSEGIFPKEEEKGGTPGNIEALVETVDCHARSLVLMAPYIGEWGLKETQENLEKLMAELHEKHGDDRERSVFACVEMSLRRLSPWVREKIKGLGVFKSGGHIDDIGKVLELDEEQRNQIVGVLIKKGLVELMSYGFLRFHPALAPYLRQRMTDEEFQQTTARWVESTVHMCDFLYKQRFKDTQLSAALTQYELPNLVALLEYTKNQGDPELTLRLAVLHQTLIAWLERPELLAHVAAIRESEFLKFTEWGRTLFISIQANIEQLLQEGNL